MKGWYGNPHKHSLASRGISTKSMKDVIQFPEIVNYRDSEEVITAFWSASIKNDFSNFDFEKAFKLLREEMLEYVGNYGYSEYGYRSEQINNFITGKEEVDDYEFNIASMESIWNIQYIDSRKSDNKYTFDNKNHHTKKEFDILLIDRIIDLQHISGSVLKDKYGDKHLDIEKMREKFDETLRRIR